MRPTDALPPPKKKLKEKTNKQTHTFVTLCLYLTELFTCLSVQWADDLQGQWEAGLTLSFVP